MSEPITLKDKDGNIIVTYAPSEAMRMMQAGEAFQVDAEIVQPELEPEPEPEKAPKPRATRRGRRKSASTK